MKSLLTTLKTYSWPDLLGSAKALVTDSARKDILATVSVSLVLHENMLINTLNGEYRQVMPEADASREQVLARCARQLITQRDAAQGILLLLPPNEFVSTRFHLAVTGESLLRSSLKLQAHTLIPACEDELLLGVDASKSEGVALWYPEHDADALFNAFEAQGLFLAAVMPRTLAMVNAEQLQKEILLIDEDSVHHCQMEIRDGAIRSCHIVTTTDLQQEEFVQQWQAEIAKSVANARVHASATDYWNARRALVEPIANYCFFARGAEVFGRGLMREKQKRAAAIAAGFVVLLLFLPFLGNWVQMAILDWRVDSLRDESAQARQSQAAVYAMEDEWGVIAEFPRQDVAQILLTLNQLISNSLTSFAVDKGVVDISGRTQDPALLVEQLSEREQFYDVGQSRSSSGGEGGVLGDRFGIRLHLNGVDFPAYEEKYSPVQQ